jgi:palmitoyltransferase
MDYTFEVLGGFNFKSIVTMIVPLVAWLFGFTATYSFFVAFVSALCVIGCLLLLTFSMYHVNNLIHGQTTHEKSHNIKDYDIGLVGNLREVFGVKWYIAWLSPWIQSPLPCDGVTFPTKLVYETTKSL